jgi:serine-type D-Ala-D-Ala carboxypeptidase/endopeptidase
VPVGSQVEARTVCNALNEIMRPEGLALSLSLCLVTSLPANAGLLPERVEKAAQERIAAGTYETLVFGVVDGGKSEIVVFGTLASGQAPDGNTVYEIGSITKTFTGTLLARAVRSGRVTLDTPVARLLPDFKIPSRGGREITLGELATHHAGLPPLPLNLVPKDQVNPFADYDAAKLKAFLAHYRLPRDPGAAFEYSDVGFGLLGHALARLEHTTYGVLLDDQVLKPLGMTMSGTASTGALRARLAPGHDSADKVAINWNIPGLAGTGAIRSTAPDMLRYLKANMGIDQSPLAAAIKLAHQPQSMMDTTTRIGLAWRISDHGIIWHPGMTWGYRSFLGFTGDGKRGVVILSNTAADADDLGFATLVADAPLGPAFRAIAVPDALLDEYEGTYKLADMSLVTVFRQDDGLFARATGQEAFPILPSAANEFFSKAWGLSVTFTRGANGVIDGLVLHQKGDHAARKLSASDLPPGLREIALDSTAFADYVGTYRATFGMLSVVRKRNHLEAQITGQPAFRIFANAKDKFFYKIVDAQLDFERDSRGKVVAVILHQHGGDVRASRVATER